MEQTFRQLVRMDWHANRASTGWATWLTARWWAVVVFRVSSLCATFVGPAGSILKQVNQFATGADIATSAKVGGGLVLFHPVGVVIGPDARIGAGCQIQQGVTIGTKYGQLVPDGTDGCPTIGDEVRIGAGARLLGRISIGDGAIIGANAVVTTDVSSGSVAVGVPARSRQGEQKA